MGTSSGGSLMMRGDPSTIRVSFENACKLSLVLAFSTTRSASFTFFLSSTSRRRGRPSLICRCAYQTSRFRIPANSHIGLAVLAHRG